MNLTRRGFIYLLIAFFSLLFSYLLVTFTYFPHSGMAASLIIFALFSYRIKKIKTKDTKLFLLFSILFSILIFVRSEPFTTFTNLFAALFFGALMLYFDKLEKPAFIEYTFGTGMLMMQSVFTKSDYNLEFTNRKSENREKNTIEIITGVVITIFVLAVILPLLASANPYFEKMVADLFNILNLEYWLKKIDSEIFFLWSLRLVFSLMALLLIPKIFTLINNRSVFLMPRVIKLDSLSLTIPKIVVSLIILVFFVTQFQYYFASPEDLNALSVSYSQKTREVFAQLSVVAFIIFGLIYNDKNSRSRKILTWALALEGIFLVFMAFKSVFEYIGFWGLTYKRLYGISFALWILGIFCFFLNYFNKKEESYLFIRRVLVFSGILLFTTNILNFDYLIYNLKRASTGQGIDYTFLSTLSADSLSYEDQFRVLEKEIGTDGYTFDEYDNKNPLMILDKIERLKEKYRNPDFRTVSLLEYMQYLSIKDINTEKLKNELRYFSLPLSKPHL